MEGIVERGIWARWRIKEMVVSLSVGKWQASLCNHIFEPVGLPSWQLGTHEDYEQNVFRLSLSRQ